MHLQERAFRRARHRHLMAVYLTVHVSHSVYLMGVYLIGVYLMACTS
jgi:hypothetical protein